MQPIDREPNDAGNLRLTPNFRPTKRGVLQEVVVIKKDEQPELFGDPIVRYMPHHATCPHAEEFRKPKPSVS